MHVLIGTDGSDDALEAAARALPILAADSVTVLTVGETPGVATAGFESGFAGGVASPDEVDVAWKAVDEAANAALDATIATITRAKPGIAIERRIEIGDPGQTLCRLAGELSADVVVVGSRGRGALKRALLGSVSGYVVHNAPCPVLVIRAED
jgi:nucleotide-binding universal stress UspA family protein